MATAFFPQGMQSYNNSTYAPFTAPYKTWKGTGMYSNPIGITSTNIRPLTNKDRTNIAVYRSGQPDRSRISLYRTGKARPLKWQFRKQTMTTVPYTIVNPLNPSQSVTVPQNRVVRSASGLENRSGGLIGQLMDRPGGYSVKQNEINEIDGTVKTNLDCINCTGISVVTDYYPEYYLSNNPLPVCTNPRNCCNEPRKALLRVRPASTNLKKNYFTTLQAYRENRCKTYEQRAFNFKTNASYLIDSNVVKNNPNVTAKQVANAKPGSPLALLNTYIANCYPNTGVNPYSQVDLVNMSFQILNNNGVLSATDITNFRNSNVVTLQQFVWFISNLTSGKSQEAAFIFSNFITNPYIGMSLSGPSNPNGCKLVVYKPNNPQFAVKGSVSSSTRTLKLTLDTVRTSVAKTRDISNNSNLNLNYANFPNVPFIYKSKVQKCSPTLPVIFRQVSYNPKFCLRNSTFNMANDDMYYYMAAGGPTVANNGISATSPGGQPIKSNRNIVSSGIRPTT